MENAYPQSRIVKALRWLAVVPVALGIQLIFAFALMKPLDMLPVNRERVSSFVFGICELICLGIASFAAGGTAPNRRALAAAIGGASILLFDLLGFFEALGNDSPDLDRGSAEIIALGFCGVAAASAAWFTLEKLESSAPPRAGRTELDQTMFSRRSPLRIAVAVGLLLTAALYVFAQVLHQPWAEQIAAPFALVGFAVNVHQGSWAVMLLLMFVVFTFVTWVIVEGLRLKRRTRS